METEAKEALFNELYRLDDEDSGKEDQSNASVILRQSRLAPPSPVVSATIPQSGVMDPSRLQQPLVRTVSAPLPQQSPRPGQATRVEKTSFPPAISANISQQVVMDTPIMAKKGASMTLRKEAAKIMGKRKRGQSLEMKSESQQIFNGLAFCRPQCFRSLEFPAH